MVETIDFTSASISAWLVTPQEDETYSITPHNFGAGIDLTNYDENTGVVSDLRQQLGWTKVQEELYSSVAKYTYYHEVYHYWDAASTDELINPVSLSYEFPMHGEVVVCFTASGMAGCERVADSEGADCEDDSSSSCSNDFIEGLTEATPIPPPPPIEQPPQPPTPQQKNTQDRVGKHVRFAAEPQIFVMEGLSNPKAGGEPAIFEVKDPEEYIAILVTATRNLVLAIRELGLLTRTNVEELKQQHHRGDEESIMLTLGPHIIWKLAVEGVLDFTIFQQWMEAQVCQRDQLSWNPEASTKNTRNNKKVMAAMEIFKKAFNEEHVVVPPSRSSPSPFVALALEEKLRGEKRLWAEQEKALQAASVTMRSTNSAQLTPTDRKIVPPLEQIAEESVVSVGESLPMSKKFKSVHEQSPSSLKPQVEVVSEDLHVSALEADKMPSFVMHHTDKPASTANMERFTESQQPEDAYKFVQLLAIKRKRREVNKALNKLCAEEFMLWIEQIWKKHWAGLTDEERVRIETETQARVAAMEHKDYTDDEDEKVEVTESGAF